MPPCQRPNAKSQAKRSPEVMKPILSWIYSILETSSEESSDNEKEIRRPGERGKSAVKEIPDDDSDDANSPIEG